MKILGLMSGSSCDGVDAAICKFWEEEEELKYELLNTASFQFSTELKEALENSAQLDLPKLKSLEAKFSKFLSTKVNDYIRDAGTIDYLASHGHTVLHQPAESYTLQIGLGSIISAETGIPTICDFRSLDMAYGGQGAPVAPIADKYLFAGHRFYLNLGGIVNISSLVDDKIVGYDIAPCNQMLNALSNIKGLDYDDGGKLAASGRLNDKLLQNLLSHEYLSQGYPKSLDNSWVQSNFTNPTLAFDDTVENKLYTSVEFMAIAIADELKKISASENVSIANSTVFCTGGGAFNNHLMNRIGFHSEQLGVKTVIPETDIIEYKEAMLMALMGYLRLKEQPNCLASVTGASKDCSGGVIYYP